MKNLNIYILYLLVLFSGCATSNSQKKVDQVLNANELKAIGRTNLSDNKLELIGSASHFGFSFTDKKCSLYVSLPAWLSHNYIQYTIDGAYGKRIRINRNDSLPVIINASGSALHTIHIYKATEAHTGAVFIEKIIAENIKPLSPADMPVIEFIGNSITCGAAADISVIPCGKGVYHDQHNAYDAYGPRLARAIGKEFILSSVSGIGIYRNWNSNGPAMPEVYTKTRFKVDDSQWDFKRYQPVVVSIALGTNDLSNGDGIKPREQFDSSTFINEYVKFIIKVDSIYPEAKIALLSSPMLQGSRRDILNNCLLTIKEKVEEKIRKPIALYVFKPMQANGCTGHPSIQDHAVMAKELEPFFRNLMNED